MTAPRVADGRLEDLAEWYALALLSADKAHRAGATSLALTQYGQAEAVASAIRALVGPRTWTEAVNLAQASP